MVRRGANLFTDKAKRAQDAGAVAAVIINTDDEIYVPLAGSPRKGHPGYGADVHIPVVCISRQEGQSLLALLEAAGGAPLATSLSLPGPGPGGAAARLLAAQAVASNSPPAPGTLKVTVVRLGFGRIVALHHHSSSLDQIP